MIVPVFVDDITIAAKTQPEIDSFITQLATHFTLRDLGPTNWLLGVELKRDWNAGTITMSQRQYCLDILDRFDMSDCNPVGTSLNPNVKLTKDQCPQTLAEQEEMLNFPYINAVGAIAYLAVATRPDLAYAVGVLARFSSNPGIEHKGALKHLLRYIKGTLDYGLVYTKPTSPILSPSDLFETFSDADHGGNPDNGKSTGGYVVKMAGAAVSWRSRLQGIVTLSSTESEYVAATSSGQELLWFRNLFSEFGFTFDAPSPLRVDNMSAISVAKNPEHHGRMKHLDLRFYWLRDEVKRGAIVIIHLRTDDMPADLMTKALAKGRLLHLVRLVGLQRLQY